MAGEDVVPNSPVTNVHFNMNWDGIAGLWEIAATTPKPLRFWMNEK